MSIYHKIDTWNSLNMKLSCVMEMLRLSKQRHINNDVTELIMSKVFKTTNPRVNICPCPLIFVLDDVKDINQWKLNVGIPSMYNTALMVKHLR